MAFRRSALDMRPLLESLVRPEQILQLVCLSGPDKVKHFDTITRLWAVIHSQSQDSEEYGIAYGRLYRVSDVVKAAIDRSDSENDAIRAAAEENQNLGIGPKGCGICINPFDFGESKEGEAGIAPQASLSNFPVILGCGNTFCYHCAAMWFKNHTHCPALGCDVDFGDSAAVRSRIDSQVYRCDTELAEVLESLWTNC